MKNRRVIGILIAVVVLLALTSSGWIYNMVSRSSQLAQSNEMATLQATFTQLYGNDAVITQLVSPEKVYAAMWTDGNGTTHVSWNIGGLWVTVWNSPPPEVPKP